uniref:Uncharacterized protein n=1 Tax=Phytophthora ramorum TaxID=164328 RepID=H3GJJ4_PHYRM
MREEDFDAVLVLAEAAVDRDEALRECLDTPCNVASMMLYKFGKDVSFLNTTSLTRPAFHQPLRRFSRYYYIPRHDARGRPPKLRYHHQVLSLVLCFYVGSME